MIPLVESYTQNLARTILWAQKPQRLFAYSQSLTQSLYPRQQLRPALNDVDHLGRQRRIRFGNVLYTGTIDNAPANRTIGSGKPADFHTQFFDLRTIKNG